VKRSRRFPEAPASVPGARQFVAESLSALEPALSETAVLLVSELATNAVVHATSDFAVTVVYPTRAGRVRVEVVDSVPGRPASLQPPPTAPHGRGLLLVASLAEEWGVEGVAGSRAGKTVWFELAPPVEAGAAAGVKRRSAGARLFGRHRRSPSLFALRPLEVCGTVA